MPNSCPFCFYSPLHIANQLLADDDLAYHIEIFHPEDRDGQSHFQIRTGASFPVQPDQNYAIDEPAASGHKRLQSVSPERCSRRAGLDEDQEYVACPESCGEQILRSDMEQHLSLHLAENIALEDLEENTGRAYAPADQKMERQPCKTDNLANEEMNHTVSGKKLFRSLFHKANSDSQKEPQPGVSTSKAGQRLGRKELGPHAYEDRMPFWLLKQLEAGPAITWIDQTGPDGRTTRLERVVNETPGLIPHLARLLEQDPSVSKAWLCSQGVKHIFKMHREGGFCGYRNIQMQISWMQHNRIPGHRHFSDSTPSILRIQEMIEKAWDMGYNSIGREETGGILNTRKFIGTPEAQALFQSLEIKCHAKSLTKKHLEQRKISAHRFLLEEIAEYFAKDACKPSDKVYMTKLPPIYFQHPGHSLTVVGFEIHKDGEMNLLVFDPMFETSLATIRYMASPFRISAPERVLKSFRRGNSYLKKYKSFEILHLDTIK